MKVHTCHCVSVDVQPEDLVADYQQHLRSMLRVDAQQVEKPISKLTPLQ